MSTDTEDSEFQLASDVEESGTFAGHYESRIVYAERFQRDQTCCEGGSVPRRRCYECDAPETLLIEHRADGKKIVVWYCHGDCGGVTGWW